MLCPDPSPKRRFRTETLVCVGCGLELSYKFQVDDGPLAFHLRQAISPENCYRCVSIHRAAQSGDKAARATLMSRGLGFGSIVPQ